MLLRGEISAPGCSHAGYTGKKAAGQGGRPLKTDSVRYALMEPIMMPFAKCFCKKG